MATTKKAQKKKGTSAKSKGSKSAAGAKPKKRAAATARAKKAAPAAKKTAAKKTAAKKTAAKKTAAKSASSRPKKAATKPSATKKTAGRAAKTARRSARRVASADGVEQLFAGLSEGERADALRILIEDKRLATMAKVGRYRVIAVEPLVVKPPHELASHRLCRVVAYDYSTDRSVEATVDLDAGSVAHLNISRAQPMLAPEEEAAAISIASTDSRVNAQLSLGDEPLAAMHYWSTRESDLAYTRRSAAVIFGQPGERPSLVAVVDLLDNLVSELVPAAQW